MSTDLKLYQHPGIEIEKLPKSEVNILQALSTRLLSEIHEIELYEIMKANISKAYVISNYTPPETDQFRTITKETTLVFKNKFGFLREAEIDLIFTAGLSKEFGEFMGLSFITFVDWAKGYVKNPVRIKLTTPVEAKKEPTEAEKFELSQANALQAYKVFTDSSYFDDKGELVRAGTCGRYGGVVYDFLTDIGLLEITTEEKNAYIASAMPVYVNELKARQAVAPRREAKEIGVMLENISFGVDDKKKLVPVAKRLCVDDFFKSIQLEETDLNELIKDKRPW